MLKRDTNENEVIEVEYINRDNYKDYIGKTVKVTGNVYLRDLGFTKLPINFTEVGGSFDCWGNKLTSLAGSPKEVGGYFSCSNNELTSLVGAPTKVGNDFYCRDNPLKTTKGKPESIGGEFVS